MGCWQIQLTQGNDLQLSTEGIDLLWQKVSVVNSPFRSERPYPLIVIADNAQETHVCQAGIYGCSITYDGMVIPCLSARSWSKLIKHYGNILQQDFDTIWKHGLEEHRNDCNKKCCRSCIDYPLPKIEEMTPIERLVKDRPIYPEPFVTVYSVTAPSTFVYGTFDPPKYNVTAYAVSGPSSSYPSDNLNMKAT